MERQLEGVAAPATEPPVQQLAAPCLVANDAMVEGTTIRNFS